MLLARKEELQDYFIYFANSTWIYKSSFIEKLMAADRKSTSA